VVTPAESPVQSGDMRASVEADVMQFVYGSKLPQFGEKLQVHYAKT